MQIEVGGVRQDEKEVVVVVVAGLLDGCPSDSDEI